MSVQYTDHDGSQFCDERKNLFPREEFEAEQENPIDLNEGLNRSIFRGIRDDGVNGDGFYVDGGL